MINRYMEIARETGYPLAYCQVGYAYLEGIGVGKDLLRAKEWYQKAAHQGHDLAMGKCDIAIPV